MRALLGLLIGGSLAMTPDLTRAVEPQHDYPIKPVAFTNVAIADAFWSPRLETNRETTIPYAFRQCEETGRIDNFALAGGLIEGEHRGGYPFDDTDPYKIAEGAAYSLSLHPDPELDSYLDDLIVKIAAAQEDDGYLCTCRTNNARYLLNWCGEERWSRLARSHELYNAGHMYEAAVAHHLATGKRSFLDVAIKNADLLVRVFRPDKMRDIPGHQEVEIGLVKLYRVTGNAEYLALARFFLDERGHAHGRELYGPYAQDHQPVVEQSEAVGHAVRASYMYAGMADVAALTADADYVRAVDRIWENVVSKKLYLTAGIGARHGGEAFGDNYELPNASAYNETCAAIGNALWNHRLFLLHGDAKYIDVLERVLYNGSLSGVSMSGDAFFYPNPLESRGNYQRSPWFGCACCPGNVARFVPSIPGYAYAHRDETVYVNLFIAGAATVEIPGNAVRITQETRYPWDGAVKMTVAPERPAEFAVHVRIPGWAQGRPVPSDLYRYRDETTEPVTLRVNGEPCPLDVDKGFARVRRLWREGDVVELNLPMPVRRVLSHEQVTDNQGKVALERGPIVYCAEWPDNGGHVLNLVLPDGALLEADYRQDVLNGVVAIRGRAIAVARGEDGRSLQEAQHEFLAIPYYAWAHRGPGEMAVWLARTPAAAEPLPAPTIASTSRASTSFRREGGEPDLTVNALNDQREPEHSGDRSVPFCHWWPHRGTVEWVQYDFEKPARVSAVELYWFDDTGRGECRVPKSWRILYRAGEEWRPVSHAGPCGTERDRYNRTAFDPVETDGLRVEVELQPGFSGGILEWKVE